MLQDLVVINQDESYYVNKMGQKAGEIYYRLVVRNNSFGRELLPNVKGVGPFSVYSSLVNKWGLIMCLRYGFDGCALMLSDEYSEDAQIVAQKFLIGILANVDFFSVLYTMTINDVILTISSLLFDKNSPACVKNVLDTYDFNQQDLKKELEAKLNELSRYKKLQTLRSNLIGHLNVKLLLDKIKDLLVNLEYCMMYIQEFFVRISEDAGLEVKVKSIEALNPFDIVGIIGAVSSKSKSTIVKPKT